MSQRAVSLTAFAGTLALWSWMLGRSFTPLVNALCIVGTVLLVLPSAWAGRRLLDRPPTVRRAAWVSAAVHASVMLLFGVAIIKAIQTGAAWRGATIPVPRGIATILVCITGAIAVLRVLNLALRRWGAPFAAALSSRLATDWLYARTRNPMALAFLACLVAVGLWLQSALSVVWVLVLVAPALLGYVKRFEEHDLEIRFGEAYRAYRASTPFLWPRGPRGRRGG